MPEKQQAQKSSDQKSNIQKQTTLPKQISTSHPAAIIQRARMNPKSLTHADVMQLQQTIGNRAVVRLLTEIGAIPSKAKQAPPVQRQELIQRQEIPEEEEPLQGKFENKPEIACSSCFASPIVQRQEIPEEEEPLQGKFETVQRQEIPEEEEPLQTKRENNTGMPDNLKAGVENLSGIDMSDVRVHYNSDKPADVGALAYTQGTEIHVAPGQERHLPHEAWHVVQQVQGRVRSTRQMKNVAINDNKELEQEADVMGERVVQMRGDGPAPAVPAVNPIIITKAREARAAVDDAYAAHETSTYALNAANMVYQHFLVAATRPSFLDNWRNSFPDDLKHARTAANATIAAAFTAREISKDAVSAAAVAAALAPVNAIAAFDAAVDAFDAAAAAFNGTSVAATSNAAQTAVAAAAAAANPPSTIAVAAAVVPGNIALPAQTAASPAITTALAVTQAAVAAVQAANNNVLSIVAQAIYDAVCALNYANLATIKVGGAVAAFRATRAIINTLPPAGHAA